MGTHSTVKFYVDDKVICQVYHQFDGYPEGVGLDLTRFLLSKDFTCGIRMGEVFNGAGDFIAQYIANCKVDKKMSVDKHCIDPNIRAGTTYLIEIDYPPEEYHYEVCFKEKGEKTPKITISVHAYGKLLIDKAAPQDYERVVKFLKEVGSETE